MQCEELIVEKDANRSHFPISHSPKPTFIRTSYDDETLMPKVYFLHPPLTHMLSSFFLWPMVMGYMFGVLNQTHLRDGGVNFDTITRFNKSPIQSAFGL